MPKLTKKTICLRRTYGRTDPNYRKASLLKIKRREKKMGKTGGSVPSKLTIIFLVVFLFLDLYKCSEKIALNYPGPMLR